MTEFIGLLLTAAAFGIGWSFFWARIGERLLSVPPERAATRVMLARGIDDAHERARDVWRKLSARAVTPSTRERREGRRVITVTHRAHYAPGATRPSLETIVHGDPEGREGLLAELITAHPAGALGIPALDADPLRELHRQISGPAEQT